MTLDEKRRLARQRIIRDYDGVPCGWDIERLIMLENEYVRRIEEEMKNAEL